MGFNHFFLSITLALATGIFAAEESAKNASPGVKPLPDPAGVHNLFALGTNLYSGSTPEGHEGYKALAKLGVKTIISVDGGKPDVELAKKFGMRYVHLPHGYDGINRDTQLKLAKAATELPGPIYVHCHHGEHRGPAAAAVICMAIEGWPAEQAEQWLAAAGTSTNYAGLYNTIHTFERPTAAELASIPADFPAIAAVSGLTESMVGIDERWEHLKAVQKAGYAPPQDHPDIDPANETVILRELYREAQRLPESAGHGRNFIEQLRQAENGAREAERLLRLHAGNPGPELRAQLDGAFAGMGKACSSCHRAYRNPEGIKSAR